MAATTDRAEADYTRARIAHWDAVAQQIDQRLDLSGVYHDRLVEVYRSLVAPGQRVLEIGCGQGDLLAALQPTLGVGVDFSVEMLRRAARRHPRLRFIQADAHTLDLQDQVFDVIVLSDVVNDLWDVELALRQLLPVARPNTRLVLNFYSRLWEVPLDLTRRVGLSKPLLEQNWLTVEDTDNLLRLSGFEVTRHWDEILLPCAPAASRPSPIGCSPDCGRSTRRRSPTSSSPGPHLRRLRRPARARLSRACR